MSICLVAFAKNETLNINEWLNFYKRLGIDKIFIFCNDENPEEMKKVVLPYIFSGFVEFYHHPGHGNQHDAYMRWLHIHRDEFKWVGFIDIDEYITLPDEYLFRANPISSWIKQYDADCIHLNWFNYGPNGYNRNSEGLILESYTRRALKCHIVGKVLVKTAAIDLGFVMGYQCPLHHGVGYNEWQLNPFNRTGLKAVYTDNSIFDFTEIDIEKSNVLRAKGCLSHFMVKSTNHYHDRAERGRAIYEKTGGDGWYRTWQDKIDSGQYLEEIKMLSEVEDTQLYNWSRMIYS